jgi:hypothetical protein
MVTVPRQLYVAVILCVAWVWSCRQVAGLDGDFVEGDSNRGGSNSGGANTGGVNAGGAGGAVDECPGCGAGKYCVPAQGCLDCVDASHCTDPNKPACIDGKCRDCEQDMDCTVVGEICHPDHKCAVPCLMDGDCGGSEICDMATSTCWMCSNDSDCAPEICHPTQKTCVVCVSDTDCPAAEPRCELNDNSCNECLVTSDCATGQTCDKKGCK